MPVVDVHAHVTPQRYKDAIRRHGSWHGLGPDVGELHQGRFAESVSQRVARMDELGMDMQLITPTMGFSQYENELATTCRIARECNDEIAEIVTDHPDRFAGLATVPLQDVPAAIDELERGVRELGLRGVVIRDRVNGRTYDEPEFLPFFRAAEDLGAIVFFHQAGPTVVDQRISRYGLGNAIGNLTERVLAFATLVFGGVMDACPDLKALLAHGGGYTAFGAPRLDKIAGAMEGGCYPDTGLEPPFPDVDITLTRAPSTYLDRFLYDCCVYDGPALRFLIDRVGVERVLLGTDCPAPMFLRDPVTWINGLAELTDDEKDAILSRNPSRLLGV